MIKNTLVKHLILIILLFASSCANLEDESIGFKVVAQGAGFTGFYIADGGSISAFSESQNVAGTASYEIDLGPIRSLTVSSTSKIGASSIKIMVYRNEFSVKEVVEDAIATPTTININYQYKEEESN